jgi:hypothetical protein
MISAAIIVFATWTGCTSQTPPPMQPDKIRSRADRTFKDLGAAEDRTAGRFPSRTSKPDIANSAAASNSFEKTAFVKTGKRPDWVDGASRQYPYSLYISGVGYGADRQAAEDKARAEIARIFYSDIHSSNRTYQEILQSTANGKSTSDENINFTEITRVSTHKILSGIKIAQTYRDRGSQPEFFALAVLDRNQSQVMLKSKVQELDADIKQLLFAVRRQPDTLSRVKMLQAGIRMHALRQAYNTELRIVDPTARGIPPPVNFTDIKTRLNNMLRKDFLIALSVEGPGDKEVKQAIVAALNRRGFSVCEEIDKASVVARGSIEINPLPQSASGWIFVRWKAYFDLIDRNGGAVFGSVQKSGKTGHLTLNHAEDRAVGYMRKALAAEISEDLNRYIMAQEN